MVFTTFNLKKTRNLYN